MDDVGNSQKGRTQRDAVAPGGKDPQTDNTKQKRGSIKGPAAPGRLDQPAKKEDTASDLLAKVKPAIPMAIAVRKLQSGDVDIFVKDQTAKDLALCQNNYQGLKVLRQDYVLEIPGVP